MQYLKDEVREKIISSALIEFKNNGYLNASMRNIAAGAKIALGSIYRYFENKEALFNTIVEPVYNRLLLYLDKIQVQINTCTSENCDEITVYMVDILNKLTQFVKESSTELIIIFNKSKGSKFENFKDELTSLVNEIILKSIDAYVKKDEYTILIAYTISHDLVEGISLILNQDFDGDKIKILTNKLIYFYITDIEKRL